MSQSYDPIPEGREKVPIILVIVGALGDWCIRRVLSHARLFLKEEENCEVIAVDVVDPGDIGMAIANRLLEQCAEDLDVPSDKKLMEWDTAGHLSETPGLPKVKSSGTPDVDTAIDKFADRFRPRLEKAYRKSKNRTQKVDEALEEIRQTVAGHLSKRQELNEWLTAFVKVGPHEEVRRYFQIEKNGTGETVSVQKTGKSFTLEDHLEELAKTHRIIVYVAVPPDNYGDVLPRWQKYAERIALEKPIAGMVATTGKKVGLTRPVASGSLQSVSAILECVDKAIGDPDRLFELPPLEVVTVDHYNTKWLVAVAEWLLRRKIFSHVFRPPRRILIEVLEPPMLPEGRYRFYNGVGGALADMLVHLLQPLRAISGYEDVAAMLDSLQVLKVRRAQYERPKTGSPTENLFASGQLGVGSLGEQLWDDTETFGEIELRFVGPPWNNTPVHIRTGKALGVKSKKMIVEGGDADGPVKIIFDIDDGTVRFWVGSSTAAHVDDCVMLQTQSLPDSFDDGFALSRREEEYVAVFKALTGWPPPDTRLLPSIDDAGKACDIFYQHLLRDRARLGKTQLFSYPPYQGGAVLGDGFTDWGN